jgi:hypothetical protein
VFEIDSTSALTGETKTSSRGEFGGDLSVGLGLLGTSESSTTSSLSSLLLLFLSPVPSEVFGVACRGRAEAVNGVSGPPSLLGDGLLLSEEPLCELRVTILPPDEGGDLLIGGLAVEIDTAVLGPRSSSHSGREEMANFGESSFWDLITFSMGDPGSTSSGRLSETLRLRGFLPGKASGEPPL